MEGQVQLLFGCLGELAARLGVRTPVQHAMFGGYISVVTGLTEFVLSIIAGEVCWNMRIRQRRNLPVPHC